MCRDMDSWGYSFRLGSARTWFNEDADDAVEFLKAGGFWEQFELCDNNRNACLIEPDVDRQ